MKTIIGIDLGVEETRIARINPIGEPEITLNHESPCSTPSAVQLSDDEVIIGGLARDSAGLEKYAFAEFIRDIGRGITHKTPVGTFSPSDLCALLLRPLIEHARQDYGEASAASIAIPYHLSSDARLEILRAATLAGIHKPNLINDHTAEALYLRNAHKLKKGKCLLVSLRAGNADATLFEVAGDCLNIVSASGVQRLGSSELRHSMTEILSEKISMKVGKKVTREDLFMEYCIGDYSLNNIVQGLGTQNTLKYIARGLEAGRIDIEISRKEFDERIASHTKQLEYLIENALDKAGIHPHGLAGCFLSTSEIDRSFWAECISSKLGMKPLSTHVGSVAMGAALYAATKCRKEDLPPMRRDKLEGMNVQDVAPYYIGILEVDWLTRTKRNRVIIPKGAPLPCTRTFELMADDLGRIPEVKVTSAYMDEENPDSVKVLQTVHPTRTKAYSKHILTIMVNGDGQTVVNIRMDDKDRDSSYFGDT